MQGLRKLLKWMVIVNVAAFVAAKVIKQFFPSQGDADTAHFDLVTILEGLEFASESPELEGGSAVVVLGGIDMDSTRATLCHDGARLSFLTVFGGIRLIVPADWRVTVNGSALLGGTDVQVADPDALPGDAPSLSVSARAYLGGIQVIAQSAVNPTSS